MLLRALIDVTDGCYIDVGAHHPVVDSVSKAFYDRGWRGIHVEPTSEYAALLRSHRADEIVIQAAISDNREAITFFEMHGLSTGNAEIAERHRTQGIESGQIVVPCLTLDDVMEQAGSREIHWLKVDVEGMECHVLRGWQTSRLPWVVVVESTIPNSPQENWEQWEPMLLEKGYEFVYFDGLNRFYVSPQHLSLKDSFRSSPNVFDGFALHGDSSAPFCRYINDKHKEQEQIHLREAEALAENIAKLQNDLATHVQAEEDLARQCEACQREMVEQIGAISEATRLEKLVLTESLAAKESQMQSEIEAARNREDQLTRDSAEREKVLTERLLVANEEKNTIKQTLLRELLSIEQIHRQELKKLQEERDEREGVLLASLVRNNEELNKQKDDLFSKLLTEKQAVFDARNEGRHEMAEKMTLLDATHRARECDLEDKIKLATAEHERVSLNWAERELALIKEFGNSREQLHVDMADKLAVLTAAHRASEHELQKRIQLGAVEQERLSMHWMERERTLHTQFSDLRERLHCETDDKIMVMVAAHRARERELQDQLRLSSTELERKSQQWVGRERTLREELTVREQDNAANIKALNDEIDQRTERLHQAHRLREDELLKRIEALNNHKDNFFAKQSELQRQLLNDCDSLSDANQLLAGKVSLLEEAIQKIAQEKAQLHRDLDLLSDLGAEVTRMKTSFSWRLTTPLRVLVQLFGSSTPPSVRPDGNNLASDAASTGPSHLPIDYELPGDRKDPPIMASTQKSYENRLDQTPEVGHPMKTIKHIDQLLELDGTEFVKATYRTLLNRPVDATGMAYYLGRLRAGHGKLTVVFQVAQSKEARIIRANVAGLDGVLASQKKANHWLTRWFSQFSSIAMQTNRLEYLLGELESRTNARLTSIEHSVEAVIEHLKRLQISEQTRPVSVHQASKQTRPVSVHQAIEQPAMLQPRANIVDGLTLPVTGTPAEIIAALEEQIAASREATSFAN